VSSVPASRRRAAAGLLVLAAVAGPAAAAGIVDIGWGGDGRFVHTTTVAPSKFAEVCGPLRKGQSVEWSFEADAAMDFNIHYHQGKKVMFPAKQSAVAKGGGTLAVVSDQDYCWMWTNKSAAEVTLKLSLKR
jgi:hypothetical protein